MDENANVNRQAEDDEEIPGVDDKTLEVYEVEELPGVENTEVIPGVGDAEETLEVDDETPNNEAESDEVKDKST